MNAAEPADDCPCCAERRQAQTAARVANARAVDLERDAVRMRVEIDALKVRFERMTPDEYESPEAHIRELLDENTLFTFQAAEARQLLREILASNQVNDALAKRIRVVLDDPPGAEKREKEYRDQLHAAWAERDALRAELTKKERELEDAYTQLGAQRAGEEGV